MLPKRQPKDIAGMEVSRVEEGIVPTMIHAAAKAKIVTHTLRRNISVLEGSGGNIAVISGRDGKLLVDAGFSVSRPALSSALTAISDDPIKHLINTHWHIDHTDGKRMAARRWSRYYRARKHAEAPFGRHACRRLELHISRRTLRGPTR